MNQKWPKNGPQWPKFPFFYIDPIWLCLRSIQLIGMRLFFFIKELWVNLLNKTLKMAIFQPKMAQKWPIMAKIPIFFYPIWLCLTSIQLSGMCLFFFIKELRIDLLNKNSKNGHFSTKNGPKMALNGQNSQFFSIDPIWLCLTSIQLIEMPLFLYI